MRMISVTRRVCSGPNTRLKLMRSAALSEEKAKEKEEEETREAGALPAPPPWDCRCGRGEKLTLRRRSSSNSLGWIVRRAGQEAEEDAARHLPGGGWRLSRSEKKEE